jgi:transposase-like protein
MRKQYSPTLKAQVVLEMRQEPRPVTESAAEYGIAPRLLHRWRREVVEPLPDLFADPAAIKRAAAVQDATVEELYAQIGKLTTQLAWLNKIWLRPCVLRPAAPWWTVRRRRCR